MSNSLCLWLESDVDLRISQFIIKQTDVLQILQQQHICGCVQSVQNRSNMFKPFPAKRPRNIPWNSVFLTDNMTVAGDDSVWAERARAEMAAKEESFADSLKKQSIEIRHEYANVRWCNSLAH